MILSIVDEKKRALDAGAAGIVAKPVDRAELLRAMNDACDPAGAEGKAQPRSVAPAGRLMRLTHQSRGSAGCRSY